MTSMQRAQRHKFLSVMELEVLSDLEIARFPFIEPSIRF